MLKSYSEMITFYSWEERLKYLQLFDNNVKSPRHMSQRFYKSGTWREVMEEVRFRDMGFDLGVEGVHITTRSICHHINPITEDDIFWNRKCLYDLNNLVHTQDSTHGQIHYKKTIETYVERRPGDTDLW